MTENAYTSGTAVSSTGRADGERTATAGPLGAIQNLFARSGRLTFAFSVHMAADSIVVGEGEPVFDLYIRNERGLRALRSLHELVIADAYVRGDLDLEGDVVRAMWLRDLLSDRNAWLKLWRRLQPLLLGRKRLNPTWVAKHYDSKNVQIFAMDRDYFIYTPGIYESGDETLEESIRRKLDFALDSLRLKEGDELLEIGCGWGGFTRFCAERGVRVTGITLSRDQLAFTEKLLAEHGLKATVFYQDFFTYEPDHRFDAISLMGVLEDLSDYPKVCERLSRLVKPGGRIYLDFAAEKVSFNTSSFVTQHIWPGTFRLVYMPELITAIDGSALQLAGLYNDRRNYYLWSRDGHQRWVENREEVVRLAGEETWRLFRLLYMGAAGVMSNPSHAVTAYRMVLELPA